jgi:hypothetical protein
MRFNDLRGAECRFWSTFGACCTTPALQKMSARWVCNRKMPFALQGHPNPLSSFGEEALANGFAHYLARPVPPWKLDLRQQA